MYHRVESSTLKDKGYISAALDFKWVARAFACARCKYIFIFMSYKSYHKK